MINLDGYDIDDMPEIADQLEILHKYATLKWLAMTRRLDGQIQSAKKIEDQLDSLYNKLNSDFKW